MRNLLCLGFVLLWGVVGCASSPALYRPVTLVHPPTGAQVTCGHWLWWECLLWDYPQHGYVRLAKPGEEAPGAQTP